MIIYHSICLTVRAMEGFTVKKRDKEGCDKTNNRDTDLKGFIHSLLISTMKP